MSIIDTRDCILWDTRTSEHYGYLYIDGQQVLAHRWVYEQEVGPIPAGLEIDHLCMVRPCVFVGHLEAVTKAENTRREMAARPVISACRRGGHPLVGDNVYVQPATGKRHCNACRRERIASRVAA